MSAQLSMFEAVSARDRVLQAFAENHPQYIQAVRAFARDIARRDGTVTIDEVRAELQARDFPMPADVGIDERVFGTLFRCKEFVPIGMRRTTREAWAARIGRSRDGVTVYRLSEDAA